MKQLPTPILLLIISTCYGQKNYSRPLNDPIFIEEAFKLTLNLN